jgi:hypothetical protein
MGSKSRWWIPLRFVQLHADPGFRRLDDGGRWKVVEALSDAWFLGSVEVRPENVSDAVWDVVLRLWPEYAADLQKGAELAKRRQKAAQSRWHASALQVHSKTDANAMQTGCKPDANNQQSTTNNTGSRRGTTRETSVVPVAVEHQRTSSAPHSRRERESTWLTPFGEAWERATDGQFAYSRSAKPLKRLVERHGAEAVFGAWCAYLRETETTYLSVERFAGTYGHWAGTVPEAVARGHDANRAAVERVKLKIAARQAAAGGAA